MVDNWLFWQVRDLIVPKLLTDRYAMLKLRGLADTFRAMHVADPMGILYLIQSKFINLGVYVPRGMCP